MPALIVYRVGRKLTIVSDPEGDLGVFDDIGEAEEYAEKNRLFQSGQVEYQILAVTI